MAIHRDHVRKSSKNAAQVLDLLIRLSGENDASVARCVGLSRAMVRFKRTKAGWYMDDAAIFGEAFDVPPELFFMTQFDAHRWLVDNKPELPTVREVPWVIEANAAVAKVARQSVCIPRSSTVRPRFRPVNFPRADGDQ